MTGRLVGIVFGLVFAGAGLFVARETAIPTFLEWRQMESWRAAPAQLLGVSGGDNYTQAEYRYRVNGRDFVGKRVYVARFNDNIGGYHRALQRRLNDSLKAGRTIQVYVNPVKPTEAVIDRDMRWGLFALMTLFCSVFIAIGSAIMYASAKAEGRGGIDRVSARVLRQKWQEKKLENPRYRGALVDFRREFLHRQEKSLNPEGQGIHRRWTKVKGWQTPKIRSTARAGLWGSWLFALLWNGLSSPLLFSFADEWNRGNHLIVIGLLFPLVGAGLLVVAVRASMAYLRFGRVEFHMDPYPGSIGGNVGGVVSVGKRLESRLLREHPFQVTLRCAYFQMSGSGKNRSRRKVIHWEQQGKVSAERSSRGFRVRFQFDVPEGLPESDITKSMDTYVGWELEVKAQLPGVDFERHFEIPVFATAQRGGLGNTNLSSQAEVREQERKNAESVTIQQGNFADFLPASVRVEKHSGEISLYYPMLRSRMLTLFAAIFAGGFGFASYTLLDGFRSDHWITIIMALFAIPFVLVAVVAGVCTLVLLFNSYSSNLSRLGVEVTRRFLLLPVKSYRASPAEIKGLRIKRTGSVGQGVNRIEHYSIIVDTKDGQWFTAVSGIKGESAAESLKDVARRTLGLANP